MPRRKIAKIADLKEVSDELPDLTEQQYAFVQCVLSGDRATDAYRKSYNCENMSDKGVWAESSRVRNNRDVAAWISAARRARLGTAVLSKDTHMQELERLREIAVDTGNVGAAIQAEQFRGKVAGHHVDRYEDVTPSDPLQLLQFIAKLNPELARQLATQYGVKWIEQQGQVVEHEMAMSPVRQPTVQADG